MRVFFHALTIFATAGLLMVAPFGVAYANPVPQGQVQQAEPSAVALVDVLKIDEIIAVMRLEGLAYGEEMAAELFSGKGGAGWTTAVALIYDAPTMRARFEAAFAAQLAGADADLPAIDAFFRAELGQHILALEVEARRSLMDDAVEDAAKAQVEDMMAEATPRFAALENFARTNDLIEMNVMGAMNSNLAFFQGMVEVDGLSQEMTEEEMLADVWAQEPDIRAETEAWIFPYLALAYGPLSDAELAEYLAFSDTAAGQKLNSALFGAFDSVFTGISRDLGRAAAKQMMGEDI